MSYTITRLSDKPVLKNVMAQWFHEKWDIPLKTYIASMDECLESNAPVPQWYAAVDDNGRIIGGMGVIQNDFHKRLDLAPNVCAVYTESDRRSEGIAGELLDFVCKDMKQSGIDTLYLITDHIGFYERYGWDYLCDVETDDNSKSRMYIHKEI